MSLAPSLRFGKTDRTKNEMNPARVDPCWAYAVSYWDWITRAAASAADAASLV